MKIQPAQKYKVIIQCQHFYVDLKQPVFGSKEGHNYYPGEIYTVAMLYDKGGMPFIHLTQEGATGSDIGLELFKNCFELIS